MNNTVRPLFRTSPARYFLANFDSFCPAFNGEGLVLSFRPLVLNLLVILRVQYKVDLVFGYCQSLQLVHSSQGSLLFLKALPSPRTPLNTPWLQHKQVFDLPHDPHAGAFLLEIYQFSSSFHANNAKN